jgi:hypothetical protein
MNSSRMLVAAALLGLAAGVCRAAEPKASEAKAAAAKGAVCPDLSGKFECPAVERYHQKAMTITVANDLAARTFQFAYDDGSPAVNVSADGKRKGGDGRKKAWSSYVCRDGSLFQLVFTDAKTKKASGGSRQRLNKDGDYEVSGPDGTVTLVCRRAKSS